MAAITAPSNVPLVDEDLPLPSFVDMFGDGFTSLNKSKKRKIGKDTGEEVKGYVLHLLFSLEYAQY